MKNNKKTHHRKLVDKVIVFLAITVVAAGAYLAYRLWDYWSAEQAYAEIENSAVQKAIDGVPNDASKSRDDRQDDAPKSRDSWQNGWRLRLPDLLDSWLHSGDDTGESRNGADGNSISGNNGINALCERVGEKFPLTYEEASQMGLPTVSWDKLTDSGRDIVAWLEIPALDIGYPVVQGEDNEYYLHHLPSGEYKGAGSLFMEAGNRSDFSDINTIIYGHNMDNGSMFGKFRSMEQNDYERNPWIWICTKDSAYLYAMFSMHISHVGDDSYLLFKEISSTAGDRKPVRIESAPLRLIRWIRAEESRSYLDMPVPSDALDRVLTLSTCASYSDERRVLQAILIGEFSNDEMQGGSP